MGFPLRSVKYHWESLLYRDSKDVVRKPFEKKEFGYVVRSRNTDGTAKDVEFSLYVVDDSKQYYLIGAFNEWGKKNKKHFQFKKEREFHKLTISIKHQEPYLILVQNKDNEELHRDPASTYFDEKGNSVFWDFDDPSTYQLQQPFPNTLHRCTKVMQTDLPGLISKWPGYKGETDLFEFITTCGVLEKIKELGFNTLQFLPVSQSIDGDNWKFRYLSPFPFALQKNWGTPDSFKRMIDKCHELGIAVLLDIILSHAPYKDFKLFNMNGEDVGLHTWVRNDGCDVFLDEVTTWGTKRFRYQDKHVRQYLIESARHFIDVYGVDGYRIDNVDGILRLGPHGQGLARPGGLEFLRTLISNIYESNPLALIHLESHYFYGDNSKMLVAPQDSNPRALGATCYGSSRLTYYIHTELMPKSADDISTWKFEQIRREKEWGASNSTIADFHNHDAAAGLMENRATGSYAYDALTLGNEKLHEHALGKIMCMEALISFGCEGRTLDLVQTFLLQKGTFEHDSSIHWNLLKEKNLILYKQQINTLLDEPAFWPENVLFREYVNIDEDNKILMIKRVDKTQKTNDEYLVVINFSNKNVPMYCVGVEEKSSYEIVFDSAQKTNTKTMNAQETQQFELYSVGVTLDEIKPYHCLVLKKENK